jgi:serine/threonine protein kinase
MAPEQVDGPSASVGPAADIYALGAILYELLTGRVPIAADDVAEFLRRVRTEPALPPSDWRADLPRNLDAICLKCLTKLPADRYPSAEALAEALQRFSAGDQQKTEEVQLVPGYAFEEELGRGGLGVVHKARQLSLDRLVALKVFHATVPAPVQRHVRAANRAMARLHHPNLLQVYDCGERDGLLYVAEEFVDGVRLDQKCAGIPRPPDEAAGLIETLAKAMDFAHRHGVIHCNLKPQVVLVSAEGMPKISSFEVARLLGQPDAEAGGAGANVVSPLYMAPEQAGGNTHAVGPATDVYGLGNILYEMLTGRAPFAGVAFGELLDRLRFQMPDPPRRVQCSVPEGLEAICLKCLQKLPEQRYASAAHLADDLSRFLRGVPSAGPAPASLAPGAGDETGPRTDTVGKSHPGIWSRLVQWFRWRPRRKN